MFSRVLIAATCMITCAICTARVTLLVNNKDGICVVHPLINFLRHLLKRPREQKRQQHEHGEHPSCLPCGSKAGRLHGSLVMTIPRSERVSTENGWKSVPLENFNCVNLNRFRLKRLIPIEHDLNVSYFWLESEFHLHENEHSYENLVGGFQYFFEPE